MQSFIVQRTGSGKKHRNCSVNYVRGHTGVKGNEEADRLAGEGARKKATTSLPKGTLPPNEKGKHVIDDSIPNKEDMITAMRKVKPRSSGRDDFHCSVWKWVLTIIDERDRSVKENSKPKRETSTYENAEALVN